LQIANKAKENRVNCRLPNQVVNSHFQYAARVLLMI
jgi:hypothetical protein